MYSGALGLRVVPRGWLGGQECPMWVVGPNSPFPGLQLHMEQLCLFFFLVLIAALGKILFGEKSPMLNRKLAIMIMANIVQCCSCLYYM